MLFCYNYTVCIIKLYNAPALKKPGSGCYAGYVEKRKVEHHVF